MRSDEKFALHRVKGDREQIRTVEVQFVGIHVLPFQSVVHCEGIYRSARNEIPYALLHYVCNHATAIVE